MKITLITVAADESPVLAEMIAHYKKLGVDDVVVHARCENGNEALLEKIVAVATSSGASVASKTVGLWSLTINGIYYALSRQGGPDDWFIVADPDEFQVYPDDIKTLLYYCQRQGYDYVEGALIDRLASSGRVATYESADGPLWSQYPCAAFLGGPIANAVVNKVVAMKAQVRLGGGQHFAFSGRGAPVQEVYVPVYHFKWINNIMEKLHRRWFESRNPNGRYEMECRRYLEYYRANNGFNLSDERFLAETCAQDYSAWSKVRGMRLAAAYFNPTIA